MQFDERRVTPFAANQSRHDVVHRTENDHGEERVKTEMRIRDARLGEVDVARDGAERDEDAEGAKDRVGNRAKHREAERRAIAHEGEIPLHRHVMIQPDGGNRDDCKDRRRDARGDHPGRKRSIDQTLHSRPA